MRQPLEQSIAIDQHEEPRLTQVRDYYQEKLDCQKFGQDGTHVHEPITITLDDFLPF